MSLLAKSITKTQTAFHELQSAIEDGRLRPGERLRVNRLVRELDMSPTPIREALRLLQADGLVAHHPHRGMTVVEYTPEAAEEIYRLRALLEPTATQLAVERATAEQVMQMRALHDELERTVLETDSRTDVAELNAPWHRPIYAACDSRYLQDFVARLWTAIPVRALWLTRRGPESVRHHAAIMEAIERGDAHTASGLMHEHIAFGKLSTLEYLRNLQWPEPDSRT